MLAYCMTGLIFFLAGFTQGISGFGAGLVAMPLLTLFLPVKTAAPLCILQGLVITGILSWQLRKDLSFTRIMPLFMSFLPGVYLGILVLKNSDPEQLKIILGLLVAAYATYRLTSRTQPGPIHPLWAYPAGFASGAITGALSAGGPPVIMYTTMSHWPKDEIKATLSGFFFLGGIVTAAGHYSAGITSAYTGRLFLATVPAVIIGVLAGVKMYGRMNRDLYLKCLLILLLVTGILMTVFSIIR